MLEHIRTIPGRQAAFNITKVPFAKQGRVVTRVLEYLGDGDFVRRKTALGIAGLGLAVDAHPERMTTRIPSASRRRAQWRGDQAIVEDDALGSHRVQVRRLEHTALIVPD